MGSYIFDGNDKLHFDSFPVTGVPFTIGVWFEVDTVTATYDLVTLGDTAGFSNHFRLIADGASANDPVRVGANTNLAASTGAGFVANTWTSGVAVQASTTSRAAFRDGANKGTNATSTTPTSIDRLTIGAFGRQTDSNFVVGHIGYVFVWNTNLSDAEVASWHGGAIPQSGSLVAAYDLTTDHGAGPVTDLIGSNDLTISGAAYDGAVSPPVSYSFGGGTVTPAAIERTRAIGAADLDTTLLPTSFVRTRAQGASKINPSLVPAGLAHSKTLGSPIVFSTYLLLLDSNVRTRALGSPKVNPSLVVTGLAHTRASGALLVGSGLIPAGLARTRALGASRLVVVLPPAGLDHARTLGSPSLNLTIILNGLVRTRALGSPALLGPPATGDGAHRHGYLSQLHH